MMQIYIILWLVVSAFLAWEYWALHNNALNLSLLHALKKSGFLDQSFEITSQPGHSLSLWLGWIGLGLMIAMNVYSIRKRNSSLRSLGKLQSWLNFHVFCGLVGPTLILFHCDFKVRGLVAISFWSMVVSFSSGIVGRYLYVQLLHGSSDLKKLEDKIIRKLNSTLAKAQVEVQAKELDFYLSSARRLAGIPKDEADQSSMMALMLSLVGSGRMIFREMPIGSNWPGQTRLILNAYAVNHRRIAFLVPFQTLMGYWHTFHFPFAVFMYAAAAIHVAAALILGT